MKGNSQRFFASLRMTGFLGFASRRIAPARVDTSRRVIAGFFAFTLFQVLTIFCTYAVDADTSSPVVSYQYLDTLAEPGTTIISPVVSYQYFDWPGDENLTFQSSPNVSYYFSGGVSLAISGTVRTLGGVPVAGAAITLKRYGTAFWSGTSTANGAFGSANLQAANFTVTVTKPGFTTLVASYGGEAGGNQVVNFWLTAAPPPLPVVATNQTPPGTAVRPPAPANPADPNAPKLMRYDGAGHFTTSLAGLDPSRMTVVLSHGWKSGPNEWALPLALLIQQHHALGGNAPNIVVWDWSVIAMDMVTPQPDRAVEQGIELGKALRASALGTNYSGHLHFIGHSLGALVNCYACDYVHGSFPESPNRQSPNPPNRWDSLLTKPHVTLLDEAEVATVFGQNVTTAAAIGWKVAQLKGALVAGSAAAAADWKNTIPKQAKWVDNYISLVGLQRDGAVNVCLLAPTVAFDWSSPVNELKFSHSYAHLFYRGTVWPSGPAPAVGFGKSYEGGSGFPPSGTGLSAGSLWFEYLATAEPLDLRRDNNPGAFECNLTILSALTVLPAATGVAKAGNDYIYQPLDATGRAVLNGYEAGIEWAGDIGGTVIYKTGRVISTTKEKVGNWWDAAFDAASDALNSIEPDTQLAGPVAAPVFSVTLGTQAAPQLAQAGGGGNAPAAAGQPAHAWMTVNVPANAGLMAFDFTVTGDPQEDSVACAVNGQNVFTLPAKFAPDGSPVSTDMIDISAYAGQSVELFFGLVGGTSTNCAVAVDGVRFITIPQPKVGLVASGANVAVKWPAAAVGWVLETSDTLAPGSWQPVPMTGVTVEQGVATIPQAVSGPQKFFRLRRNP